MKAYQVKEFGKPLSCSEVELPKLQDHEVLVKTLVTGVCHTDLHVMKGDLGKVPLPITPGHEGLGIVVSLGPNVATLKEGDRVGVPWLGKSCTQCELCRSGYENLCNEQLRTGFTRHGSFAEYFVADERFAAKIPEGLRDEIAAPILCAGLTSYKALINSGAQKGNRIVISGACGGLGHLGVQYAKVMGYETIAMDMLGNDREKKTEFLKKLGADMVIDISDTTLSILEKIAKEDNKHIQGKTKTTGGTQELLPSKPVKAAIIFAPVMSSLTDAIHYVAPHGTIVLVSFPQGVLKEIPPEFILKELRLIGSIVGTPKDLQEALNLAQKGVVPHIEVRKFDQIHQSLTDLEHGKVRGRIVLRVSEASPHTH